MSCLEKFQGVDVKYHSAVVFASSSPKMPKYNKFGPTF